MGESRARSQVRVTPQELGNHWWESKIKFFLITSCKKQDLLMVSFWCIKHWQALKKIKLYCFNCFFLKSISMAIKATLNGMQLSCPPKKEFNNLGLHLL